MVSHWSHCVYVCMSIPSEIVVIYPGAYVFQLCLRRGPALGVGQDRLLMAGEEGDSWSRPLVSLVL